MLAKIEQNQVLLGLPVGGWLGGPVMKSVNFEFLRAKRRYLADLAGFAEQYMEPDPSSALIKLRTFSEMMVNDLYAHLGLVQPYDANLNDLLVAPPFQDAVPRVVVSKLHLLRKAGNQAVHEDEGTAEIARKALHEAFHLGTWFHVAYDGGSQIDVPVFKAPPAGGAAGETKARLKHEKRNALQRLANQEARLNQVLDELEATRTQLAKQPPQPAAPLQLLVDAGAAAANTLEFSEEKTRRDLIDIQLAAAGWRVGPEGRSTPEVGQEVEIDHQPTTTGKGYADYVLWDPESGKPLAVIEAKKTATDTSLGQAQARHYANGLEKMHGQRPIIFVTNGVDIYLWNDAGNFPEPPRKVYGFYSKDSLDYVHYQREHAEALGDTLPNNQITDRPYQLEAVKRVAERFDRSHRKSLIVQATGTGKTRVAVALSDILLRAKRGKRILFLCDRRALRKQARNAYKTHLPDVEGVIVKANMAKEQVAQVYFATYPAMLKIHQRFDVGFFDIVIADESHRSIYRRYKELFHYFDALQIGLTATPVRFIDRNTYELFGCEDQDPTANYSLRQAIDDGYLAPFEAKSFQTEFQRVGIKYDQMSDEQKAQLEQQIAEAEEFEYEASQLDRLVINKDTNRLMLRNLMDNGIRVDGGQTLGKSIVFARNHRHAVMLKKLFDEMYPHSGGGFCSVIDTYDSRAEALIDDFKGEGTHDDIQIAISVDMLDTGIDVPEIVNLVFAKPVKSYVKFWQMIGRGTRLCPNLLGPGQDKDRFVVFDHWGNFDYFGEEYREPTPGAPKSRLEQLFAARLELADYGQRTPDPQVFETMARLLREDIIALEEANTINVREHWKAIQQFGSEEALQKLHPETRVVLSQEVGPLMRERDSRGSGPAYEYDLLMTRLQLTRLRGSAEANNLRGKWLGWLARLTMSLAEVQARAELLQRVKSPEFWETAGFEELEEARTGLRDIMKHVDRAPGGSEAALVVDIEEDRTAIEAQEKAVRLEGLEFTAYRKRVEAVFNSLLQTSEVLQRIRSGAPVSEADLEELVALVTEQDPGLDLRQLGRAYPRAAGHLDIAIRRLVGMAPEAVQRHFAAFHAANPELGAAQIRFLDLLARLITEGGAVEVERLYEPPFTSLSKDGLDGVFDEAQADEIVTLVEQLSTPPNPS